MAPPVVIKQSGIFLLRFNSEDEVNRILAPPLNFVFDKPLLLKKYEIGMKLGKKVFTEVPCWIRFPGLALQYWTPAVLSRMTSKLGKPLLANSATIQRTRMEHHAFMVELNQTEQIVSEVKLRVRDELILQQVVYDWHPKPCSICDKWGHLTEACDPERRNLRNGHQKRQHHSKKVKPRILS